MATVVAAWTRSFLEYAQTRGLERWRLFRAMGMRRADLPGADERMSREADALLWSYVDRELGDAGLGFRFAETLPDAGLGIASLIARASDTVASGLRAAACYHALIREDGPASFGFEGDIGTLRWNPSADLGACAPPIEDALLAICLLFARRWTGENVTPIRIRCQQPRARSQSDCDALFGCPVEFGSGGTEISFSRDFLQTPLRTGQTDVLPYLNEAADALLQRLDRGPKIDERVRRAFARVGTDLSRVAGALDLSPRTLQRRLREQGSLFDALVDEHRRNTVLTLLRDPSLTRRGIVQRAGFSSSRSLRSALRRWQLT